MQVLPAETMPEHWYEPSETRDMAARERAHAEHTRLSGIVALVVALIAAALLIAR